jgi:hypothetical protein
VSYEEAGAAGLLVLRLWIEPDRRMRVRVTRTADLSPGQETTTYAASKAEVLRVVEQWLDELASREPQ